MQQYIEVKMLDASLYTDADGTVQLPKYATEASAGIDLVAAHDLLLKPGQRAQIKTGLAIYQGVHEDNMVAFVVPRSGMGKKGLVLQNTIGVIDADYQGEILCNVFNNNSPDVFGGEIHIKRGDRFAQMVFLPIIRVHMHVVEEFSSSTVRGAGGFGSTGS